MKKLNLKPLQFASISAVAAIIVRLLDHADEYSFGSRAEIIASSRGLIVIFCRVFIDSGAVYIVFELIRGVFHRRSEAEEERQIAAGI